MTSPRTWQAFPTTYRAQEMRTLAQWILAGESGSVVGLSGCGRANLLGFLCDRPEVMASYLRSMTSKSQTHPVALIPIDLNNLPADDPATLYRVFLRAFYWINDRFDPAIKESVTSLYQDTRTTQDPFLAQSALHEALFAFQAQGIRVVLVLNHFDRFCQRATSHMLNTLRGLRDSFKEILCFITGMLQEAAYLSNPEALGDIYELLDSHVCWVSAMNASDARWVISQATHTAAEPPLEKEIESMSSLAGNFPVLLKAVGQWWLDHRQLPLDEWLTALTSEHHFDYRLERIWRGLTLEEQYALSALQVWQDQGCINQARALDKHHAHVLPRLTSKGLCHQINGKWKVTSEMLAEYVKRVGPMCWGRISLDANTDEIYQGLTPLRNLTPQEDLLLRFLIKRPYKRNDYTSLLGHIFAEDKHERDRQDLFVLVRGLRQKVEANPSEPRYVINETGRPEGFYRFYPEGRPE